MSRGGPPKTVEELRPLIYAQDKAVKLAGIDVDGILRGKLVNIEKFWSIAESGFGFCSVIFGWDMHDLTYTKELLISNAENGYHDIIAKIDISSFRRIPWEGNIPFFLVSYHDPDTGESIPPCPRSLLRRALDKANGMGFGAMAGAEYEFYQFLMPNIPQYTTSKEQPYPTATSLTPIAAFLQDNPPSKMQSLSQGMFGYSMLRTAQHSDHFHAIYNTAKEFRCPIESWHTESGPGVYEAALAFTEAGEMADRAALFKFTAKSIASKRGIVATFMAKPKEGLPGTSGHLHISLVDKDGKNLFARDEVDPSPPYPDVAHLSDIGRWFLAGVLDGMADVMPLWAPNVNSYKRLVENFWAPVTVSWGLEHRAASVRLIGPPSASKKSTRLEVRVPGADANPHFCLGAIIALGLRGVEKKLDIPIAPLGKGQESGGEGARLEKSLRSAITRMARKEPGNIAREVLGDAFVEHFCGTREHECRLWEEAVTDWEVKRYIETV